MQIQLNFEINEKVLKEFGIDMDSKTKQELKDYLMAGLDDDMVYLTEVDRCLGAEKPVHRRRLGLAKALVEIE